MGNRSGLRVRCQAEVHRDVRSSCLNFCKWLRINYEFPIRVVIYLKKDYRIKNKFTKELVTATFFAPYNKEEEPHIRIATGDYLELIDQWGEIDALYSIINSIAHEINHYFQWLNDKDLDENEAMERAEKMIDKFIDDLE